MQGVKLLGVCGRKRHGKDTIGEFLREGWDYTPIAFADPIKRICMDIYGLSYDQCYGGDEYKEVVDERWGLTPRYIMQRVGTEMGREVHKETWVRYCFEQIERARRREPVILHIPAKRGFFPAASSGVNASQWVVTDVRLPDEARAVQNRGGRVIKAIRPSLLQGAVDMHQTETCIDDIRADHLLLNDGGLAQLRARLSSYMGTL